MPLYFDVHDLPPLFSAVEFKRRNAESGETVTLQTFVLTRTTPHRTHDNRDSAVMNWRSDCLDCGSPYTFTSGLSSGAFYRRCKKCRRGKQTSGWPSGPRIRHVLLRADSNEIDPEPDEIDPLSLF